MIYQNILNEISPYMAGVMRSLPFGEHRHADIELQYCINDKVHLTVNKKSVTVKQGELILVSPMSAHSVISEEDSEGKALLVVVGVSLLKNFFSVGGKSGVLFFTAAADTQAANDGPADRKRLAAAEDDDLTLIGELDTVERLPRLCQGL